MRRMGKKAGSKPVAEGVSLPKPSAKSSPAGTLTRSTAPAAKPSALLDTRVVYCGDCLEQLRNLPDACVDLVYLDPPFNCNNQAAIRR